MTPPADLPPSFLPSTVPGLDRVLGGGIPQGALALIMGPPVSGKTTLAHQIAFATAHNGRKVVVFTAVSEPTTKLLRHLRPFPFFDATLLGVEILFLSLQAYLGEGIAATGATVIAAARKPRRTWSSWMAFVASVASLTTLRRRAPSSSMWARRSV